MVLSLKPTLLLLAMVGVWFCDARPLPKDTPCDLVRLLLHPLANVFIIKKPAATLPLLTTLFISSPLPRSFFFLAHVSRGNKEKTRFPREWSAAWIISCAKNEKDSKNIVKNAFVPGLTITKLLLYVSSPIQNTKHASKKNNRSGTTIPWPIAIDKPWSSVWIQNKTIIVVLRQE